MSRRTVALLDVTMMQGDSVCIAGVDVESGATLRLNHPQPRRRMLHDYGGLRPGDVIAVEWVRSGNAHAPHIEDGDWDPVSLKRLDARPFDELMSMIKPTAFKAIPDALGTEWFEGANGNHGCASGAGERSLATIQMRRIRFERERERVRVALWDAGGGFWRGVPFQDLSVREHATTCAACRTGQFAWLRTEFEADDCLVRMGLTRPFPPEAARPLCWLQVTNIFARPRAHFV